MKLGEYPQMDVADARHRTLDYRAQIATGLDPQAVATVASSSQLTLRTFVTDDYLPHAYATKRSAKDDEGRLRNILPEFGDLPLGQISSHSIQQFHDRLRVQKCAATANRHLALLKRCFNLAIIWGKLDGANPVRGIRMHQENNQRQRYLSGNELRSFLTALDEEASRPLADALRFLLMTGARRNEVLLARWDAIDIDKRQWFLPNTKSGKSRFVLLNDGAIELLRQRDRQAGNVYVFPGKNAGEAICRISSHAIQQFHDRLRVQRCAATANRHLALLKRCLNLAIIWGKLNGPNPVRGIRMHQENNQRQRYLSDGELRSFLTALDAR